MRHSKSAGRVIFWDFDRTLAFRPLGWGDLVAEAFVARNLGPAPTSDEIQPLLQTGYPWHAPEIPHPELDSPAKWWERVDGVISRAYVAFGLPQSLADEMAAEVHARYIDPAGYVVYDDSVPTLRELTRRGWRHFILSNHVPELPEIVTALGLRPLVEEVITSATVDYEKPNPEIFRLALDMAGDPAEAWMVGDNVIADVMGAETAGIEGILVRDRDDRAKRYSPDLAGVIKLVTPED